MIQAPNELPMWAVNLRKWRKHWGYSQASFGAKFGVSRMAVSYWESATNECPTEVLAWLLEASGTLEAGLFFKNGIEI